MPIARALIKYGKENFTISTLENCSGTEELKERERFWIKELDTFNSGYNATLGGEGTFGYKHTEEAKRKISESNKGRACSEENKKKISKANMGNKYFLGRKHNEKAKQKMSKFHKGKKLTEEHKLSIGKAGKGRIYSEESKQKMSGINNGRAKLTRKDVIQIREMLSKRDVTQQFIADKFGVSPSAIYNIKTKRSWN